jgi:signal transduction histidine kinase
LISNAIKYRRDEVSPIIKIFATGSPHSEYCEINFQDNGIGFDEKYLDRIFKPFQRLHRHDQFKGTGMGLAICKKIVERHNGTVTAKSKPKKGTTFTVKLPRKQIRENTTQ